MRKFILIAACILILGAGFISFNSIKNTRTKDYCVVRMTIGLKKNSLIVYYGNNKSTETKCWENCESALIDLFHSLNSEGWKLHSSEIPHSNEGGHNSVFYIFERDHRE